MASRIVYLNGRYLPLGEATISPLDRGFLYGDGLFETIRAYRGTPFMMGWHLQRLLVGLERIHIHLKLSEQELTQIVRALLRRNELGDAYVRISISRGRHMGPLALAHGAEPTVFIYVAPFAPQPPEIYTKGVSVTTVDMRERLGFSTSDLKALSFLGNLVLLTEARGRHHMDAIAINARGEVADGMVTNVFAARDGVVRTPALGSMILPGVTRRVVLDLLERKGVEAKREVVTPDDLRSADEVFLTNSLMEVVPVRQLDDVAFDIVPGPLTHKVLLWYREEVHRCLEEQP